MNNKDTIRAYHLILISMTVIGLKNHVTIIPPLLRSAGRDGWMSVILVSIILVPWIFLLLYIHRQSKQQHLLKWMEKQGGKVTSITFLVFFIPFLFVLASFTMRETLQWMNNTFLMDTPIIFLLIVYSVLCIALAATNIQTIVITNIFLLFFITIFGFFVGLTNIQFKDYSLLRPFLEHGFQPVMHGLVYPASGIVELVILLFIQHHFKNKIRFTHYLIIYFILAILTLGPLVGAIIEFGPEQAAKQRFPAYEEWRLARIGRFIEHVDFFSIYQWLSGAFLRVSIMLYVVIQLLNMHGKRLQIWTIIAPAFFSIGCILLFAIGDEVFVKMKGTYMLPATFLLLFFFSLFFGVLAFRQQIKSRRERNET